MSKEQEQLKICDYLFRRLEEKLTLAEENELKRYMANTPDGLDLYISVANLHAQLSTPNRLSLKDQGAEADIPSAYMDLLEELGNDERHADAIEIAENPALPELIDKVVYPSRVKREISKFTVVSGVLSVAAMIFLVLFVHLVPTSGGKEVATLTDSFNAKWADVSMQNGARLFSDGFPLMLREGLAQLHFDNRVRVTIEAPAEFEILADDRIGLNYGKVYAMVPKEAIGFSVYTKNAKIVDMGTEFGVHADSYGDTILHVIEGKTILMAEEKNSMEVAEGTAKKVSRDTQRVTDISCNETYFVRAFDSVNNVVWRQPPKIDLADVVRGGNGQGTGNSDVRLNPINGFTRDFHLGFSTAKGYLAIPELAFIDGVFVPDGPRQIVSSRNDVFAECPETSGMFDMDLFANPKSGILKTDLREGTIEFNGREYTDESGHPCILLHSNLGLTFDLDAIRKHYRRDITRFTSQAGIADLKEDCPCNADFWVLVDGQVRYSLRQYKEKGVLNDISVEIKPADRFLTLVTTDGGDPDDPGHFYTRAVSCDWGVFTEPVLILE